MVSVEYFPSALVKNAPEKYGIYTWYYLPQFSNAEYEELIQKLNSSPSEEKKMNYLRDWLVENYYKKFWLFLDSSEDVSQQLEIKMSESWMNISPTIKLTTTAERFPQVSKDLLKRLIDDEILLKEFLHNLGNYRILPFMTPLYIGMAERGDSTIKSRLSKHIKQLKERNQESATNLAQKFKPGKKTINFATRAAVSGIGADQLWFATYPINDDSNEDLPASMENLLNRITIPRLGSN